MRSTKHKPYGPYEKIFKLYKFRTMTDKRDEKGDLLPDSERLTKFGEILRATSLDAYFDPHYKLKNYDKEV